MIIIDLDYTLYRTDFLIRDMKQVLAQYGVGEADFHVTYKKSLHWDGDGYGFDYSFDKHVALLQSIGFRINADEVLPKLQACVRQEYLFDDAIPFLQFLRAQNEEVVLLTAGNPEFQKMKVATVGIEQYVDRTVYLSGNKDVFVKDVVASGEQVWFINDNSKENARIKKLFPRVHMLGIINTFKYAKEDIAYGDIPYFATLTELQAYMREHKRTTVLILAAGKGTRLNCADKPKVMIEVGGKPMVEYLVETLERVGFTPAQIVMVVGFQKEKVIEYFGRRVTYVHQAEQLGTGHAVAQAQEYIRDTAKHIVVLYGDMPFLRPASIIRLIQTQYQSQSVLAVMTTTAPDFQDWRAALETFGRVIRNEHGDIARIVEWKDATSDELRIRELSTCFFCFEANWLWQQLDRVKNENLQGEYYLVDVVAFAVQQGRTIASTPVELSEAVGVNRTADVAIVEQFIQSLSTPLSSG